MNGMCAKKTKRTGSAASTNDGAIADMVQVLGCNTRQAFAIFFMMTGLMISTFHQRRGIALTPAFKCDTTNRVS